MLFRLLESRHPLARLRREMDRLLSGAPWDGMELPWLATPRGESAANCWETGDAFHVELEVPGVKSEQLDVSVVGDQLSIKVERPEEEPKDVTYHRRERPVGSFTRVVCLPSEVDAGKVEAELEHGVLSIHLPKAESVRPRKIQVTAGR